MVIQAAPSLAVHEQLACVVIVQVPFPPRSDGNTVEGGESVYEQAGVGVRVGGAGGGPDGGVGVAVGPTGVTVGVEVGPTGVAVGVVPGSVVAVGVGVDVGLPGSVTT